MLVAEIIKALRVVVPMSPVTRMAAVQILAMPATQMAKTVRSQYQIDKVAKLIDRNRPVRKLGQPKLSYFMVG